MNKGKSFFREALIVYIMASFLNKFPFRVKIYIYVLFVLYCLIRIVKSLKEKSLNIEVYAILAIVVFAAYNLAGTFVETYYKEYEYIFHSNAFILVKVLLFIIALVLLGFYGYSYIDESDRESWLGSIKIISIICLIILWIIGLLYIL